MVSWARMQKPYINERNYFNHGMVPQALAPHSSTVQRSNLRKASNKVRKIKHAFELARQGFEPSNRWHGGGLPCSYDYFICPHPDVAEISRIIACNEDLPCVETYLLSKPIDVT